MAVRFTRCRLRFSGMLPVELGGNRFDQCEWDFVGPARDTLAFLQTLYHDQGGVELVEKLFGVVRDANADNRDRRQMNGLVRPAPLRFGRPRRRQCRPPRQQRRHHAERRPARQSTAATSRSRP